MAHALQVKTCEHYGPLPYQVSTNENQGIVMDAKAFKWVDDHVRSLDLVLLDECDWVSGTKELLQLQVLRMMALARQLET
ncbi:hypothetical protein FRC00_010733, partial [Tulasnella sp. 408]